MTTSSSSIAGGAGRRARRRGSWIAIAVIAGLACAGIYAVASDLVAPGWKLAIWGVLVALVAASSYQYFRSRVAAAARAAHPTALRMDSTDAAWLHMDEPGNPADIVLLVAFERAPTFDAVETAVAERLLRFDRFRQRVVEIGGHPHWETDDDFRIENHVLRHDVDAPLTEQRLAEVVATLGTGPLASGRPLWSVHVVRGADGAGALVVRLHHCIGDGFALAHAIAFPARGADEPAAAVTGAPRPRGRGQRWSGLARTLGRLLTIPFDRATVFEGKLSGRRRMAWSAAFPLDIVKAVARSRGATLNDVLMAALTGAMRRFLSERGELVGGRPICAIVPVNLRPARWIEEVDDSLGNRFGLVFLDLPVCEPTIEARFGALRARMDAIKATPEAAVAFGILNALGHGPANLEHLVTHLFARKASLVVSNVPGPRAPVYFGDARVRQVMFWEPHPGRLGLAISILTYAGTVAMGARSDEGVVADPQRLVELFEAELSTILEDSRESVAQPAGSPDESGGASEPVHSSSHSSRQASQHASSSPHT